MRNEIQINDLILNGAMDSARTAHILREAETRENWWFPQSTETWNKHLASAEALALRQLFEGAVLVLPRNQYIDSPVWFKLAPHLLKIKFPTFAVSIIDLPPVPSSFVKDVANAFDVPEGVQSAFAMSAWPGLDVRNRRDIAINIRKTGNFSSMFLDVPTDSKYKVAFEEQQAVLISVHTYLEETFFNSSPIQTIFRSTGPRTSLWQKISRDLENQRYLGKLSEKYSSSFVDTYRSRVSEVQRKAEFLHRNEAEGDKERKTDKWLSARSNWLVEIHKDDNDLRETLRFHIDNRYIYTLGESVTAAGSFGTTDRADTGLDHEKRDAASDELDFSYDPQGLAEDFDVLFSRSKDEKQYLKKIPELLNEDDVLKAIVDIRVLRRRKSLELEYIREQKSKHLDFLETRLPGLMVQKSDKGRIVGFAYDSGFFTALVVGSTFIPEIPVELLDSDFLRWVLSLVSKKKAEDFIEKKLGAPGKALLLDALFAKEKTFLTGKMRDWLRRNDEQ